MNRQQFIEAMHQPDLLNDQSLEQIREVINEYPFFQAGRLLWVKNLRLLDHIRYNNELKLAAAHIPDRAKFFDLLHSVGSTKTKTAESEPNIEIVESEVDDSFISTQEQEEPTNEESVKHTAEDFFSVSDIYETALGVNVDFSEKDAEEEEVVEPEFLPSSEDIILPTADFLGFGMEMPSEYRLPAEEKPVNEDESRSFSEWLNVLRNQPIEKNKSQSGVRPSKGKNNKMSLIDSFLEQGDKRRVNVPKTDPGDVRNEDFSVKSLQENDDLMTETLANIYIRQTHFYKAIDIFEQLRLKYPEKNIYFARRIKELEEQINNQ